MVEIHIDAKMLNVGSKDSFCLILSFGLAFAVREICSMVQFSSNFYIVTYNGLLYCDL